MKCEAIKKRPPETGSNITTVLLFHSIHPSFLPVTTHPSLPLPGSAYKLELRLNAGPHVAELPGQLKRTKMQKDHLKH